MFDHIISGAQSAAAKLRVRSALNPMLWLCAIVSIPSFALAYCLNGYNMGVVFLVVGSAPVLTTIIGFLWFMVKSPEKLQSEEYQLRHEAFQLIRQKGTEFPVSPSSLAAIANPSVHASTRGDT